MIESYLILLFLIALLVLVTSPFTVLIHELGHAIPAILLTRKKVSIYIGSHGDPKKSLHFSIGLLEVWFTYNPFSWRRGLCVPSAKQISINKQIIYTLSGPLASVVIATVACYFIFDHDLHGSLKLIFVIFLCSSIFDLFVNLIPRMKPDKLNDSGLIYNDGYLLKELFYYKRFPKKYKKAAEFYNQQEFTEAGKFLNDIIKNGLKDEQIYRLAISSFLQVKNYKQAKELSDEFLLYGKMNSEDFANAGFSYSELDQHDIAIELYDKSLELNPDNLNSLNNKGFTFNLLNKFENAIPLFDKAIEIDKTFAFAYSNRGLAKIKIGKTEEGLEDINYSLKLDENNSYGYRNLGIYYLDKGEYSRALDLFKKAKEFDDTTYMIDELILEADRHEAPNFENFQKVV